MLDELKRRHAEVRIEYYMMAVRAGLLTPNEVRQNEGLRPIQGGDQTVQIHCADWYKIAEEIRKLLDKEQRA